MEHRTGRLYFIDGKFFEKVGIGNEYSIWDEELRDITEEVINTICGKLNKE